MRLLVGSLADLPTERCQAVGDGSAVVVRVGDEVIAFPNRCLHQNSPLDGGIVLDGVLICPQHFWRYQLPEGSHIGTGVSLPTYPVEVKGDQVWVELPDPPPPLTMREMLLKHAREWRPGPPIKAVIWDMGGVFRRYFTEALVDVGRRQGWPLHHLPLGPTGEVPDPDYWAMAEGEIDEPEYLTLVTARLRGEGITLDVVHDVDWAAEDRPETWAAITRIHQSPLQQAILTNDATRWMGPRWWEAWEPSRYFDHVIDVATLGKRKPHPAPYVEALARVGQAPAECVFVDDMPVNCRGAEAVGMRSVWFDITRPRESIAQLMSTIQLEAPT